MKRVSQCLVVPVAYAMKAPFALSTTSVTFATLSDAPPARSRIVSVAAGAFVLSATFGFCEADDVGAVDAGEAIGLGEGGG